MAKKTKMDAPKTEDNQQHLSPLQALAKKQRPTVKDLMKATEAEIVDREERITGQINKEAMLARSKRTGMNNRLGAQAQTIQDQGRLLLASFAVSFVAIIISIIAVLS